MSHVLVASSLLILLVPVGACRRPTDTAPPQIRYGDQECAACRMLISDERFAAALVYVGEREVVKLAFDDVNCVFSYLAEHPLSGDYKVYAHDLDTRAWLDARSAVFVHSAKLETPMASQVAAAATRADAERLRARFPGELLTYEDLSKLFASPGAANPGSVSGQGNQ